MPELSNPTHRAANRAVRAVLSVLPSSAEVGIAADRDGSETDLVVAGQTLRVCWIGEGTLGRATRALAGLEREPAVMVARLLSPGARAALTEAGVGWVDETGAAEIATGTLVISRSGQSFAAPRAHRWTRSVLAVAEALLCGTVPTVSAARAATGLSTGSCTNALRFLATEGLLGASADRGRNSARSVTDADRLLEAYAKAAEAASTTLCLRVGLVGRDPVDELADIGRRWTSKGIGWAATGLAAASVLAPLMAGFSAVEVYVAAVTPPELEAIASKADLRPIEGGQLALLPFPTVTAERMAAEVDDLRIAPWPRVFVDLLQAGVRGEQAAEHLHETIAST